MRKIRFVFPVLCILMLAIFSCNKDNPVVPHDEGLQPDSPRFNWQVTRMPYFGGGEFCYSLWSPDTNEVFMCSIINYLVHFKDGQFSTINYGPNIRMFFIDGLSPTEGYIIGSEHKNGIDIPHIERWNGSSFMNVPINYNFDKDFHVSNILIKSSTEMWFSSPKGIMHKFDGYNLTQYYLPDTMMWGEGLLYDESNRLRYLTTYFDGAIDTLHRNYVYEFNGTTWSKVYEDITPLFTRVYGTFNNIIFAYSYPTSLYKLNNNVLSIALNVGYSNFALQDVPSFAGKSLSDFMGFAYYSNGYSFFHWNGQKWSYENVGNEDFTDLIKLRMINDNYFCGVKNGVIHQGFLYRGYRKNIGSSPN